MEKLGGFQELREHTDQELVSAVSNIFRSENELAARRYATMAEVDRRGLAMKLGHSSATRWFARSTRITDGAANHHMALAHWLNQHPTVQNALFDSDIHAAHARAIADGLATVETADSTLHADRRSAIVADLLETAVAGATASQVSSRAQVLAHAAAEDARARYLAARFEEKSRDNGGADAENSDSTSENSNDQLDCAADAPGSEDTADVPGNGEDDRPDTEDELTEPGSGAELAGPPPVPVSENTDLNRFDIYTLASGRHRFSGDIDRLLAEKLLEALNPLTAPRPGPSGERDPRSASKRRADALDRILDRHLRGGQHGERPRPSVHLTVPLRDLLADSTERRSAGTPNRQSHDTATDRSPASPTPTEEQLHESTPPEDVSPGTESLLPYGVGDHEAAQRDSSRPGIGPDHPDWPFQLDWTGPISRQLAQLVACDADLTPVIVDHNGVPLAMGRTIRFANSAQRAAVTLRDKCCVMCGRPAQWCEFHHVIFWDDGGMTDVNNLALMCGQCHRLVHNSEWEVVMGDDNLPYLVPPESIDAERKRIPSFHRRQLASIRASERNSAASM